MAARDSITCTCGGRADRQVTVPAVRSDPFGWSNENNGKGRYIGQLQRTMGSKKDPNAYCKNRQEGIDKARRMGLTVDKSVY
jgi:hypothetical protein